MLFKNKAVKNEMYLASCDVIDMKNGGNRIRVGNMLLKNKKDAEKWMKNIHENYFKDDFGNVQKNWKKIDYLCFKTDGCEYYTVEYKNESEGRWTRHELYFRPINFAKIF